jgi:hypothetical protein
LRLSLQLFPFVGFQITTEFVRLAWQHSRP